MSDEQQNNPAPGTSAVMVKEQALPAAPAGLKLGTLVPGLDQEGGLYPVYLNPSLGSDAEGQVRADFELPDDGTVKRFDDLYHGLGKKNRGKPDEWGAVSFIIKSKFVDLVGVDRADDAEIKRVHGSWKAALLADRRLRPLARSIASAYVGKCRVQVTVEADGEE